jgi:chemotaxis protein CheC
MSAPGSPVVIDAATDRLRELASIGSGHAATSLARLVRRTIRMRVPVVRGRSTRPLAHELRAWDTGIFFEIEGGPGGVLAVLFPAAGRDALLRALLGPDRTGGASIGAEGESALREVGNILASSVVSAIADTIAARVLISVPVLALAGASGVLAAILAARGAGDALRIETEIGDGEDLRVLVTFVPRQP